MRDVSVPIVVSGIGIGCQPHKPQKVRHTNVLFGQLDLWRPYGVGKVEFCKPAFNTVSIFKHVYEFFQKICSFILVSERISSLRTCGRIRSLDLWSICCGASGKTSVTASRICLLISLTTTIGVPYSEFSACRNAFTYFLLSVGLI